MKLWPESKLWPDLTTLNACFRSELELCWWWWFLSKAGSGAWRPIRCAGSRALRRFCPAPGEVLCTWCVRAPGCWGRRTYSAVQPWACASVLETWSASRAQGPVTPFLWLAPFCFSICAELSRVMVLTRRVPKMWLFDYSLLYGVLHSISLAIAVGFCQQIPDISLEVRNGLLSIWMHLQGSPEPGSSTLVGLS